ncbi:sugar kinase [Amycolatopsis thailandensis]|uniref:Sugar kinase n=1 Tax=Amycolatopsis thailandensis TaxID=589330 RepID=A0A229RRR1_9PSEU|nr:sugar kinase [Amycolatopsis thailandensis]
MRGEGTRVVRRGNESFVLSALYLDGPLSRKELSAATGLSPSAVSQSITGLVQNGLVREAGKADSNGGRPRTLLDINPTFGYTVGVAITGRALRIGLFDLSCRRIQVVKRALSAGVQDIDEVARELGIGIRHLLSLSGVHDSALTGIGIGLPSSASPHQAIPWTSRKLESLLGLGIPVFIEREVNIRALVESRLGAARGVGRAVVVQIGLGVEASLVADGTAKRIRDWGHTTIDYGGRSCHCGARGCVEAYVGASGILQRSLELPGREALLEGNDFERLRTLVGSTEHCAAAHALVRETAGYIGAAVGNLIALLAPARLVISGWAGQLLGSRFLPEIRDAATRHGLSPAAVLLGRVEVDATLTGAAVLPVLGLIKRGTALPRAVAGL